METIIVIKKIIVMGLIFVMVSNAFALRQTSYEYRRIIAPQPMKKIAIIGLILANLPAAYAAEDNGPLGLTALCMAVLIIGVAIGCKLYTVCHRTPIIVPAIDIDPDPISQTSNSTTIVNLHSEAGSPPNTPVSGFSSDVKKFTDYEIYMDQH